jgi:predicted MPP superfamily phosphohydrolase
MKDLPLAVPLLAGVAAAGAAALAVRAFLVEPARIELSQHPLPIPELPEPWIGQRVVHLTDLHYGNPRSERLFREMVETTDRLDPDLILITGDFVTRTAREVGPSLPHLRRLRARHGVIAVLGDHDYDGISKRPITGLVPALQEIGIRLLRNEGIELPGGLRIAGVDPTTGKVKQADLRKALRSLSAPPHLLLSHSPDIITQASIHEVAMILCGHTHGGQVVVPGYGPPVTHTRVGRHYASGWSQMKGTRMYTGRGLGSHFSLRFCCPPEITEFTLVRDERPLPSGKAALAGEPAARG